MDPQKDKWYFRTSTLVVALLIVGPLALPLVWFNPRFSLKTKIIITLIVALLTYLMVIINVWSLNTLNSYLKQSF